MDLQGKKLLIIGGAFQHRKLVEAAHNMGVIVYVVDYLPAEKAPAKQIADYHYEYNITDYDDIVALCEKEHIDGVLSSHLDACQIPYQVICERLGLPCFGTKEQFRILTDKTAFLKCCIENGVDIIPQYEESDFASDNKDTEYPVFVKPCDSRGSRGQTVCRNYSEVKKAIDFAKSESKTGKVVIEKYMGGKQDFSVTYFVRNGCVSVIRLCDRYVGKAEDGLDKQCAMCIAPSRFSDMFMENVNDRVANMIKSIGIKNGPVFMQGFIDGDTVRMYDPGLRFPGGEYESLFTKATDISFVKPLIEFALTGQIGEIENIFEKCYLLNGKFAVQIDFTLKPGCIGSIDGVEKIKGLPYVVSFAQRYFAGNTILSTGDVRQRFCEIAICVSGVDELIAAFDKIKSLLKIYDTDNNDMIHDIIHPKFIYKEK